MRKRGEWRGREERRGGGEVRESEGCDEKENEGWIDRRRM